MVGEGKTGAGDDMLLSDDAVTLIAVAKARVPVPVVSPTLGHPRSLLCRIESRRGRYLKGPRNNCRYHRCQTVYAPRSGSSIFNKINLDIKECRHTSLMEFRISFCAVPLYQTIWSVFA